MIKAVVNGFTINGFQSKQEFLEFIDGKTSILIAMNAEKILKNDPKLRNILNENIAYPDGVGAVMVLKQKGIDAVKIPGSEFWLDIIRTFHDRKSFYLLGSSKEVIGNTVTKLRKEFPQINIVGFRDGYLKDGDIEILINDLQTKKPDVVFVAQGSPRQEFLMNILISRHSALYMGLGGSFDIYGGSKNRAPELFLKLNLEWLYRLLKEPTRIGRQLSLLKFLVLLLARKL